MPKVLNIRKDKMTSTAIYIGRPSKWGNPYTIGKDGTRERVIAKYRARLLDILSKDSHYLDELRGKNLLCFCSPLPCHGDVLLELANRQPEV